MLCKGRMLDTGKRCRAKNLNTAGYCWFHWQKFIEQNARHMSNLFIIRDPNGDSIGYVTIHSNGVQFQADDDVYTGKLTPRESIKLATEILEKYSVEYNMMRGKLV